MQSVQNISEDGLQFRKVYQKDEDNGGSYCDVQDFDHQNLNSGPVLAPVSSHSTDSEELHVKQFFYIRCQQSHSQADLSDKDPHKNVHTIIIITIIIYHDT